MTRLTGLEIEKLLIPFFLLVCFVLFMQEDKMSITYEKGSNIYR